jgi:periplasmic protein CpxP/Spy
VRADVRLYVRRHVRGHARLATRLGPEPHRNTSLPTTHGGDTLAREHPIYRNQPAQRATMNLFHLSAITGHRRGLALVVATALLALLAATASPAFAQPMGGPGMGGRGEHGPGMHRGGPGGPDGAGGGMHLMRMLDQVNATPEQRAQIRQIMQAAHTDMKAQRETGRQLRQQQQALFTQPNVDANAVEALRQRLMAHHDATSRRMSQAMLEASRVLSPEQRRQMADKMAQRRTMGERHRAEREALEGAPRRP